MDYSNWDNDFNGFFIMKRMSSSGAGGQIFNIGKSKAQLFDKDKMQKITFSDVAGTLKGLKMRL